MSRYTVFKQEGPGSRCRSSAIAVTLQITEPIQPFSAECQSHKIIQAKLRFGQFISTLIHKSLNVLSESDILLFISIPPFQSNITISFQMLGHVSRTDIIVVVRSMEIVPVVGYQIRQCHLHIFAQIGSRPQSRILVIV